MELYTVPQKPGCFSLSDAAPLASPRSAPEYFYSMYDQWLKYPPQPIHAYYYKFEKLKEHGLYLVDDKLKWVARNLIVTAIVPYDMTLDAFDYATTLDIHE